MSNQVSVQGGPFRTLATRSMTEQLPSNHFVVPLVEPSIAAYAAERKERIAIGPFTTLACALRIPGWRLYAWRMYSRHAQLIERSGPRIMFVRAFDKQMSHKALIAWGARCKHAFAPRGYRPAFGRHELRDFYEVAFYLLRGHRRLVAPAPCYALDGDGTLGAAWLHARGCCVAGNHPFHFAYGDFDNVVERGDLVLYVVNP